ncbi:hypothetical protein AUR64_11830 [Haloprofundus marisrubri]|uniref:DUF5658 domain-containing protein n=1 Tax=Haloprofundus marisrubri TaxID=1514971 RepID=A0A0W1R9Z7_9EURY|nr:DUF5658 family protein [Haloprofundus marisrubri]KTG10264.1 hypothetical protein AUR64_11830 [Haloprofundus marisrubri]
MSREDLSGLGTHSANGTVAPHRSISTLSRYEPHLWAFALLGFALDVGLTAYGLSLGLAEMNPLARTLMETVGVVEAMLLLKSFSLGVALVGWKILPALYRFVVPAGLSLPTWVAVGINSSLIISLL